MKLIYSRTPYKWIPYKVLTFYVIFAIFTVTLGPLDFEFNNFYLFLTILYLIAFLLISKAGMAIGSAYKPRVSRSLRNEEKLLHIIELTVIAFFPIKLMLLISMINMRGLPTFNNLFVMFASAYTSSHSEEYVPNVYRQIDTFFTGIYYLSLFSSIYWRKKLRRSYKYLLIINVLIDLIYRVFYLGTQGGVFMYAVSIIAILAIDAARSGYRINKKKFIIAGGSVLLIAFLILNTLSARGTFWNKRSTAYIYNNRIFDLSSPLLFWCRSDKLKYDVCMVLSYATQGVYGLSLTFQVPFKWTYMLGGSRGLNSIASQLFSFVDYDKILGMTYPLRAGKVFGYDGLVNWFSVFPWLASDLTFFGALIYMGIYGWLFMRCWIQSVEYDNPIAFAVLVILIHQYILLFANNTLFGSRGGVVSTLFLLFIYFAFGKKFDYSKKEVY